MLERLWDGAVTQGEDHNLGNGKENVTEWYTMLKREDHLFSDCGKQNNAFWVPYIAKQLAHHWPYLSYHNFTRMSEKRMSNISYDIEIPQHKGGELVRGHTSHSTSILQIPNL
jgi:hypothetical protein